MFHEGNIFTGWQLLLELLFSSFYWHFTVLYYQFCLWETGQCTNSWKKKKKMPSRLASHIVAQRAEAIHMRGRSPGTEGGTNRFKLSIMDDKQGKSHLKTRMRKWRSAAARSYVVMVTRYERTKEPSKAKPPEMSGRHSTAAHPRVSAVCDVQPRQVGCNITWESRPLLSGLALVCLRPRLNCLCTALDPCSWLCPFLISEDFI